MSFAEALKKPRNSPVKQKRILLIDDHVDALIPLNLILGHLGVEASLVFDGFAARRAMRDRNYDLIVIDWLMPHLNGAECLAFADANPSRKGNHGHRVPFVVYSGLRREQISVPQFQHFYQIGHWRKPMLLSELTQKVNLALQQLEK